MLEENHPVITTIMDQLQMEIKSLHSTNNHRRGRAERQLSPPNRPLSNEYNRGKNIK